MKKALCTIKIGQHEIEATVNFKAEIPNFSINNFIIPINFLSQQQISEIKSSQSINDNLIDILDNQFTIKKIVWASENAIWMDLELLDDVELFTNISEII